MASKYYCKYIDCRKQTKVLFIQFFKLLSITLDGKEDLRYGKPMYIKCLFSKPLRPAFAVGSIDIEISLDIRTLTVDILPEQKETAPG